MSQAQKDGAPGASKVIAGLEEFATLHDLLYVLDKSTDGLPQVSVYSHDKLYRYAFARWWRAEDPLVLWVGLNPAKGDTEQRRRPTLERCIAWSKEWRAGGLIVANLFAARHNKPQALRGMADPVGPHNDAVLRALSPIAESTVVAWGGNDSLVRFRAAEIVRLLIKPRCLGITASGQPRHPLYVRADVPVRPWPVA